MPGLIRIVIITSYDDLMAPLSRKGSTFLSCTSYFTEKLKMVQPFKKYHLQAHFPQISATRMYQEAP